MLITTAIAVPKQTKRAAKFTVIFKSSTKRILQPVKKRAIAPGNDPDSR